MDSGNKILVIFETSKIRNPNQDYGKIDFGVDFNSIKEYIIENGLNDKVSLAITKFTIDELSHGRKEEFDKEKKVARKFVDIPNVKIMDENFDYKVFLEAKIKLYLDKNNILVIPYPKKEILYKITKRSLNKDKPFIKNEKHSDYGFKDVVIWESILNFRKIDDYYKIIFVCNDFGFDEKCEREFNHQYQQCNFKIIKDHTSVIEDIKITTENSLMIKNIEQSPREGALISDMIVPSKENSKFNALVSSQYFKDGITEYIISESTDNIGKVDVVFESHDNYEITDWIVDDEVLGVMVSVDVYIKGLCKKILVFIDESGGIEKYEINE